MKLKTIFLSATAAAALAFSVQAVAQSPAEVAPVEPAEATVCAETRHCANAATTNEIPEGYVGATEGVGPCVPCAKAPECTSCNPCNCPECHCAQSCAECSGCQACESCTSTPQGCCQ